ncbi:hypothetical protein TNCV_1476861 [Trichonephila clavipes]|nr:hypothetical protein TNCV_1476861 [Trichonephila clavipes]
MQQVLSMLGTTPNIFFSPRVVAARPAQVNFLAQLDESVLSAPRSGVYKGAKRLSYQSQLNLDAHSNNTGAVARSEAAEFFFRLQRVWVTQRAHENSGDQ